MKPPMLTRPDLTVIAALIVDIVRNCTTKEHAYNADQIADQIAAILNSHVDARRIRSVIAEENTEISKALAPAVLVSQAPWGYWLASNADELKRREELLWKLECRAREKRREFIASVRAAGFGGILPIRKVVAA